MPKRRITADGDVVTDEPGPNGLSGVSGGGIESLFSGGTSSDRLDVFGFSLEKKQCVMVLLLCMLMLGLRSTLGVIIAWVVYRAWSETSNSNSQSSMATSRSSNPSAGSTRWSSRVSGNSSGGGGSNIRGISDLPCDPRRG